MASLLSWAKQRVHQVENIVHHDVVSPINRDIVQPVAHVASAIPRVAVNDLAIPIAKTAIQAPLDTANLAYNRIVAPTFHLPNLTPTQVTPLKGISKRVGATGSLHQTVGADAQLLAMLASGGLSGGIERGVSAVAPKVGTLAPRIASNAALGAGFNASAAAAQGAKPKDILKSAGIGGVFGGAIPVAGEGLKLGAKGTVKLAQNAKPLNEVGAVGKNLNKDAFTKADQAKMTEELAAQNKQLQNTPNLSELTPKQQMLLAESKTGLAPPEINTGKNPFKANIPNVKQGDYGQVIANEQAASKPIKTAGDRALTDLQNLQKNNPQEYSNFWRYFQDPKYAESNKSPQLNKALQSWRLVDNRIHGTSQALGGNTNYLQNHGLHPWDLPEEFANHIQNGGNPDKFAGLGNLSRKYQTIAEGEKAGLKLKQDPLSEAQRYIGASSSLLKKRAIIKSATEADAHMLDKTHSLHLGAGEAVPLSEQGARELRGLQRSTASTNKAIRGLRTANVGAKSSLLSLGQFHPINISALRAAPTLMLTGHPLAAAKGLYGTFRPLAPGGTKYVEKQLGKAVKSELDIKLAKIGMPLGSQGFDTAGSKFVKGGIGHKLVFEKQMPMMHIQVGRSIVKDLENRGVSLDSPEARLAGRAGNNLMGFVNSEAQKVPPNVSRRLGDWLLARQFTHSKFSQIRTAATPKAYAKGAVAGQYATANVIANGIASASIIGGVGYLLHQKSDNIRDILLRALVDPAIPTPMKDTKGNTVKLRLPGTDTSDIAKLLGVKLVRQSDGHLGVNWNPNNLPSTISDYARARLAPFASAGVKVATNSTFANYKLFDPTAPFGTKAIQAGTSLGTGILPIGAQGIPMLPQVEKRLPKSVQAVLDQQKPGGNPVVKSLGSSFGVTPTTDNTVGKAQQTAQYYAGRDKFASSLGQGDKNLFNKIEQPKQDQFGNKVKPTGSLVKVSDYGDLVANPSFTAKYQTYQKSQASHDPLWDLNPNQLRAYMNAQVISKYDPGGDSSTTSALYKQIPESFYKARTQYFDNLKSQGVKLSGVASNKPAMPQTLVDFSTAYHNLPYGTGARSAALRTPTGQAYIAYLDKNKVYNNQQRADLGLPPLAGTSSSYSSKSGYARGVSKTSKSPFITTGFKTAFIKAPSLPKGVKPTKPKSIKSIALKKQSVKKLPVTKRKLS